MRPYNSSIFNLRTCYADVFHEPQFQNFVEEELSDSSKIYKVSYYINMLPMLEKYAVRQEDGSITYENDGVSLMTLAAESDELDIFDCLTFQQLIKFKWDTFAWALHMRGCVMHFFYLFIMILYINSVYISNKMEEQGFYSVLLIFGVLYPTWYDTLQLIKVGPKAYFSDLGNYSDILYTWGSIVNVYLQNYSNPQDIMNKIIMGVLLLQQLIKSFFYLRIFDTLSYIVTMINRVIYDLRVFLLFYFILIIIFSQIFAVIGVGNKNLDGGFKEFVDEIDAYNEANGTFIDAPNEEYGQIGLFFGYIIQTLRNSLGDFDFEASTYLTFEENIMYWIIWFLVIIMTCIVFLNFIIAEASNSYESVKQRLNAIVHKEKGSLIAEAEEMTFESRKDEMMLPKYIIIRVIET